MYCFSVQRLFLALKDNPTQQALSQVACWCVGEYGDVLVHGSSEEAEPIQVIMLDWRSFTRNNLFNSEAIRLIHVKLSHHTILGVAISYVKFQ